LAQRRLCKPGLDIRSVYHQKIIIAIDRKMTLR